MYRSSRKKDDQTESLFEKACRLERMKKRLQSDALFFGLALMLAIYSTQTMSTIQ